MSQGGMLCPAFIVWTAASPLASAELGYGSGLLP